jgi:hypothetical protein
MPQSYHTLLQNKKLSENFKFKWPQAPHVFSQTPRSWLATGHTHREALSGRDAEARQREKEDLGINMFSESWSHRLRFRMALDWVLCNVFLFCSEIKVCKIKKMQFYTEKKNRMALEIS